MTDTPTIAAIVPMRSGSQRVVGKNIRPFNGAALYHSILKTLDASQHIDSIYICTDIAEITADTLPSGLSKPMKIIPLSDKTASSATPMNKVIEEMLGHIEADYYLQTHSTNPLLKAATLDHAIGHFLAAKGAHDSMFSVTKRQTRFWDGLSRPMNHNPDILIRTQDLPPVFEENSCFYLFTKAQFTATQTRIGARPYMAEMDPLEAIDIDTEDDFNLAELIGQLNA